MIRADGKEIPIHLTVTEHNLTGQKLFIGTLSIAKETDSSSEEYPGADSPEDYTLFDHLLHSTIVIDQFGIIKYVNSSMEKFSGYLKSELLGTNVKVLMPPEITAKHDSYIERYVRTRQPTIIGKGRDVDIILKDKTIVKGHLEVTEHTVSGNLRFIGTLTVPKTEYGIEQMVVREKHNISILNVPIIMITDDGIIRDLNSQAETEFGYPAIRAVGKNVTLFMTKEHAKKHNGYIRSYINTGKSKIIGKGRIVRVKCKNGAIKNCHLNVTVKQEGSSRIFLGMLIVLGVPEEAIHTDQIVNS
jgi:PAS domain S-box-containing protein